MAASTGTGASPEIHLGAAELSVANSLLSGSAVPKIASPGDAYDGALIHFVQPVYPVEARKQQLEGMVELRLVVDTNGRVRRVNLVTGSPLLASAAIRAARQFRYRPALLDGRPIETIQTADIYFQLKH